MHLKLKDIHWLKVKGWKKKAPKKATIAILRTEKVKLKAKIFTIHRFIS